MRAAIRSHAALAGTVRRVVGNLSGFAVSDVEPLAILNGSLVKVTDRDGKPYRIMVVEELRK